MSCAAVANRAISTHMENAYRPGTEFTNFSFGFVCIGAVVTWRAVAAEFSATDGVSSLQADEGYVAAVGNDFSWWNYFALN